MKGRRILPHFSSSVGKVKGLAVAPRREARYALSKRVPPVHHQNSLPNVEHTPTRAGCSCLLPHGGPVWSPVHAAAHYILHLLFRRVLRQSLY